MGKSSVPGKPTPVSRQGGDCASSPLLLLYPFINLPIAALTAGFEKRYPGFPHAVGSTPASWADRPVPLKVLRVPRAWPHPRVVHRRLPRLACSHAVFLTAGGVCLSAGGVCRTLLPRSPSFTHVSSHLPFRPFCATLCWPDPRWREPSDGPSLGPGTLR